MSRRPLRPEDMFSFKAAGDAQLSPDGQSAVYLIQRHDGEKEKSETDLYLADLTTGESRRLTSSGNNDTPRFAPDGRRLAFLSSRGEKTQLYILDLAGGEAWQLPTDEAVGSFLWFPDSERIAYTAKVFSKAEDWVPYPGAPAGDAPRLREIAAKANKKDKKADGDKKPNEIKVITRFRYRVDGVGYLGDVRRQVFVVPVPAAAPLDELKPQGRQVTTGDYDHDLPAISPDGRYLIVAARRSETADYDQKQDLWLFDTQSAATHLIYDGPGPTSSPCWSPNGALVAFTGHDNSVSVSTTSDLWLLNVDRFISELSQGAAPVPYTKDYAINVTRPLDRPVGCYAGAEMRYAGGTSMFWQGEQLYFLISDHGASGIHLTDASGQVTTILADQDRSISSLHGGRGALLYTASRPDQPEELYYNDGQSEKPVARVNDALLAEVELARWEKIVYPSDDGQLVDGWILYPTGYEAGKQYPLALIIHGGPHGAYGPSFMFNAHLFASNGYAVLYTNPRGSQTYGQHFACCIDKNWGDRDYADIMAGVDAVLAKGLADPNRLFVYGWSYGGYMTSWIVTQTKRFKAACAGAPVVDLHSDYGTADITWSNEHEYGGRPWQEAEHLLKHSPLSYADHVETPLLLLHGEGDLRCPIIQSEEFYIALKRQGKTVYMVRYPGEYHGPRRHLHRLDRYQRLLAWFDHYSQV